jgi:hypothetical protein
MDPVLVLLPPLPPLPPLPELSSELDIELAIPLLDPLLDFAAVLFSCPLGGVDSVPLDPDPPVFPPVVVVPPLPDPLGEDPLDPFELPELPVPLEGVPVDPVVP